MHLSHLDFINTDKGTLIYDGSSRPSTVTTDSLLSSDINGKGGDDAEIVLAKLNVPFISPKSSICTI